MPSEGSFQAARESRGNGKSLDLPDMVSSSEHRTMIWALSVSRGCREPAGDEIPMHGITATEYPSHPLGCPALCRKKAASALLGSAAPPCGGRAYRLQRSLERAPGRFIPDPVRKTYPAFHVTDQVP